MKMDTTTTPGVSGDESSGLTKRAALIMAANVIAMSMTFMLPLVLVRTLNQSEFGLYKQSFQILLTALGLLNLQVAVSVFYFMAREPGKKLQVALNVALFYGLVGASVCLFFLVWPGWVTLIFQSADLVPYVPLIGVVILLWLVASNLEAVPIAAGDVRIASILIVVSQLTKAIVMITAALIFGDIASVLVAAMIQAALQIVYMAFYLRRRFGRIFASIDWPLFKAQIGSSLPFGVGGVAAIVQSDMHNYFVSHYFDSAAFAVYSVGCFQLPLLGMLSSSFASALNPELAKHKEAGNYRAIVRVWMDVMRKLALFFVPAFAAMFVLRYDLITALFTRNYEASVPVFAVNLFAILLGIAVHLHILRVFDQLKYFRLKLYLALIPVTFGALYLGLRSGGLVGVAIAVVFVQTLDVGITLLMVGRKLEMSRSDLKYLQPLLRVAAAAAAAALAAIVARLTIIHAQAPARLALGAAAFGAVYPIAVFVVGAITREEQTALREMISKYYERGASRLRLSSTAE
jgi:O-antigen/teichoic acid export membrane protein